MKESKYNYYITENGKGIIFNGRTKRFFVTSLKTKGMYETILHSPNDFVPKYEKFLNKMKVEVLYKVISGKVGKIEGIDEINGEFPDKTDYVTHLFTKNVSNVFYNKNCGNSIIRGH